MTLANIETNADCDPAGQSLNGRITHRQLQAIQYVADHSPTCDEASRATSYIQRWLQRGIKRFDLSTSCVTINFHPDRLTTGGDTVIESVLRTGQIFSQFVSMSSNGFPLSHGGHLRARRESAIFGGAYDTAKPEDRPKYGSISGFGQSRGGWPRFGSCHWILENSVVSRCTATIPGSHASRAWSGTYHDLVDLAEEIRIPSTVGTTHRFHLIDGLVEVQIHGEITLERDVTTLAVDPSFRGTEVARVAERISQDFDVTLHWTPRLASDGLDWKIPSRRVLARHRILNGRTADEPITAEWIGRDGLCSDIHQSAPSTILDGARKYLWNRLLLSQEIHGDAQAFLGT